MINRESKLKKVYPVRKFGRGIKPLKDGVFSNGVSGFSSLDIVLIILVIAFTVSIIITILKQEARIKGEISSTVITPSQGNKKLNVKILKTLGDIERQENTSLLPQGLEEIQEKQMQNLRDDLREVQEGKKENRHNKYPSEEDIRRMEEQNAVLY